METLRKPFQGIKNIISFNRHFYLAWVGIYILALGLVLLLPEAHRLLGLYLLILTALPLLISLIVSFYIYDASQLYELKWLQHLQPKDSVINIHAGFDETSKLIQNLFPNNTLHVFDFYDPKKHTERSIQIARKAHPPYPETITVTTNHIPLENNSTDTVLVILSAHEIRDNEERILFFKELYRVLKPGGKVIVAEHLRDWINFFAYTIGVFHFHSKGIWLNNFKSAGFKVEIEVKHTPFISIFTLAK